MLDTEGIRFVCAKIITWRGDIMVWEELEYGWQMAFSKAWDAFCSGTIPVGAVIINETGELVSTGQNMIFMPKVLFCRQ